MDMTESAKNFLRNLGNPEFTHSIVVDRVGKDIDNTINDFISDVCKVKERVDIDSDELLKTTMLAGYLLRTHIERIELEELLGRQD